MNKHTGRTLIKSLTLAVLLALGSLFAPIAKAADINVLVVGDTRNSFLPTNVATELRKILEGANMGTVNVVFEDMATAAGTYYAGDLLQWFYWPYPANVERTVRWPNLRGEAGTQWDYVVLTDDYYNIEKYPGAYAAGVASVAGEVSKGTAEPVLLMQWPKSGSTSTVAHYEEVVYRVGNSGGYKVAPAGLAWQAAGSPVTANQHPNSDGAYIAAATLFSTIWNKSATNSTYNPKPTLAQTAFNTFTNSLVTPHYTGKFNASSKNAFGFYDLHPRRIVCGGNDSSSENGVKGGFGSAMILAGCTGSTLLDTLTVNTQRYMYSGAGSRIVYGFEIQTVDTVSGGQDEYCSNLDSDMYKMTRAQDNNYNYNTDVARHLPTRMLCARIAQRYPNSAPFYANHIAPHINDAMGSFAVTQLCGGGRSPMKPPEQVKSEFDYCFQAGYELAWQFRHLQVRAPGFRFIPDSLTVGFTNPETIRVKFYNPPKSNVTVTVTSAGPVTLENATLTFTPENYNVAQEVRVLATAGAVIGSTLQVECTTSSADEVYDGIHDAWNYKVNRAPTSANIAADAFAGQITPITLKGNDPDGEALTYQMVEPPKYGTVTITGPVASYTPDAGFTGSDSFTYKCNDSGDDSNVATVIITIMPQSPYDFNLLRNPGAELTPLADYGWVGDWYRALGGTEGSYNFKGGKSLSQIVDISRYAERIARGEQSFSFSADLTCNGYADRAGFTVDCLNAAGNVVQTDSVSQNASFTYGTFSGTFLAPTNTASIRVTIKGWAVDGTSPSVCADRLKLVAVKPPNMAPVAYDQSGLVASAGIPNPVTLTSWDIDKDDLVYIIVSPPSHGTISGGVGAARFYTPNAGYEGPDSLTFRVFDRELNSNIATVSFNVVLNQAPRIVLDSPRTDSVQVPENVDLLLRTTVWDDGLPNPLTYTWSKVSGVINGTNAIFTNPSEPVTGINLMSGAGSGVYRLTVSDGAVTVTKDINVAVSYDQERNIGAFIYRQESYAGTPGVPLTMLGARAADDGKPIPPGAFTYEFLKVSGPGNAVFEDATVESPTVTFDRAGSYVIRMIVNDGEVEDYNDIPVTITSAGNVAPVANAVLLSPAAPKLGDTVTLSGAGSFDSNLDALTFSWVQTSGTSVTLSATNVMEPTFVASDRDTYTFDLTVSDGQFSSTTSVVVKVLNAAPLVDAGEQQEVYLVPGTIPWTPKVLTMAAWYDASVTGTITSTSGAVSQWNDQSGNGRNLSQATSTAKPKTGTRTINGLNAIEFDGADDVLTGASNRTDAITIFGVVQVDSGSGTDGARAWLSAPGGGNPDYQMTAPANTNTLGATMRDTSTVGSGSSAVAARNSAHIHAAYSWVPNGQSGAVRIDGGAASSQITAKTSGMQKLATELAIGRQKNTAGRFHDGLVGEVIIINRRLTEADDEFLRIEGYLAHKWKLTGNLPAGHPYKSVAPVSNAMIATISLDGTVSDPDPEDILTSEWSVKGGNDEAVFFGDVSAPDTAVTFAQAGTYVLRLTADDGSSKPYDEVTITATEGTPVARAGENQTLSDSANNGSVSVTLDGSASSDPDGTITSYAWHIGDTQIATGSTPTVVLPVGVHEITLTVTDNHGSVATDTVAITVHRLNIAPSVNAGLDQTQAFNGRVPIPWTPVNLTSAPAAWYDGADASTITQSSGVVSQWRDKSAAARNLNQTASSARPKTGTRTINGLNAIEFDGSNDVLLGAANRTDAITIFGVVQVDSGSGTDGNRSWLSAPGGSNPDFWMVAPANSDTLGASILNTSGNGNTVSRTASRNSAHIHAAYSWIRSGAAGGVRVDGGAPASIAASSSTVQKSASELAIGRQKNVAGRFHDGLVGEVIILNRRLRETDDEFLKIEGYLAHKWGLTANLPEGHPYKTAAPSSGSTLVATATLAGTASDAEGDPLTTTWSVISTPADATVQFADTSALGGTATFDQLGAYVLKLTVSDGVDSRYDEVTITVVNGSVNNAPVAAAQSVVTAEDTAKAITLTGSDEDTDPLTYAIVTQPAHGTLSGTAPNVTYTPAADYNGADSFTFKVNDGTVDSTVATVSITVTAVGDAPVASAGADQTVSLTGTAPVPWTPVYITPAAWYDGADAATITQSGGAVSQWNDKSPNNRHVSQATSAQRPTYSSSTVNFDGTDDILVRTGAFMYANGSIDIYVAGAFSGTVADKRFIAESNSGNDSSLYCPFQTRGVTDFTMMSAYIRDNGNTTRFSNSTNALSATGAFNLSTRKLYQVRDTGSSLAGRVNGGTATTVSYTRGTTTLTSFGIGGIPARLSSATGSGWMRGNVNEIVIVPSLLDDANRQRLEGYLAHKWGMTANLPANHPYKSTAPTQGVIPTATATLAGSASDADNNPLTTTWTVVSKPIGSTVIFSNASALNATATFSALGDYTLRLTANDGGISVSDDVVITVTDGSSGLDAFNEWAANGGITFNGDSNSDGIADGMGWLLGAESSTHNANGLLPQAAENNGDLTLSFKMLNASQRGSAVIHVQYSSDLGITDSWSNHSIQVPDVSSTVNGVDFIVTPINGTDHNQVQVIIPASAAGGEGKVFARLQGMLEP